MIKTKASRRGFLGRAGVATAALIGSGAISGSAATVPQRRNSRLFDVHDFGAKGDGKTVDSHAINKAIEAAAEAGEAPSISLPEVTYVSQFG
jgi:polygalacturonase